MSELKTASCDALDGTDGLVVRDDTSNSAEITIHLDHLFFDSWVDEEPAKATANTNADRRTRSETSQARLRSFAELRLNAG